MIYINQISEHQFNFHSKLGICHGFQYEAHGIPMCHHASATWFKLNCERLFIFCILYILLKMWRFPSKNNTLYNWMQNPWSQEGPSQDCDWRRCQLQLSDEWTRMVKIEGCNYKISEEMKVFFLGFQKRTC